ncbi:DUF499 domain-containing protein [Pseudarthrobacter enclensis]|uniref:AAA+ superfamily ATPase n=1 Tax=Pseudarthrobacter enclensis TaxID=993070 RepID=A0ABT9RSR5_9MICC|nr:DUF499 domain-containing protein [Pseudarthrobacter enclensis]MDP9888288.1 putative AAA+ superfamily ATPase [Pseudarthrobacter enclensis]
MAESNLDRIGKALDILATSLEPFVAEALAPKVPAGKDWTIILAAKDSKNGAVKTYNRMDSSDQLRALTEILVPGWFPFEGKLSPAERNLAGEARDIRNKWAHRNSFNFDDAYRALDTLERLLRVTGDPKGADQVRSSRDELRNSTLQKEIKKAATSAVLTETGSSAIKPWRDVVKPHADVISGTFNASEFAADLHMVAQGIGSDEYIDPVQFFRRTYLTEGLKDLLGKAVRRIGGDLNAPPVINLQTNFGGGKTHSMLALWHIMSGHALGEYPQEIQELLNGTDLGEFSECKRAVLVGNHLAVTPGKDSAKADGTVVNTLWGELAWQLGGREGYSIVKESDVSGTNPGASLRTLLSSYSPSLILIDEWVAYARQLYARDGLPAGTFDTQFTFAQTLTEAVKSVPGVLLVVSIPASDHGAEDRQDSSSDLEVGGANGKAALERLQNVVRRVADQWRPATSRESFEIVRRRLFEAPTGEAPIEISATARQFAEFYKNHRDEFPVETTDREYERRIAEAYPIHPELFERLYRDWSTLERFQRTRGVLRLMSTVVHELWTAGDRSPMIMPGSVPLDADGVLTEITQYLDDQWKPIIDADVDGPAATPAKIDASRPAFQQRLLTRRLARAIFLGSAPTLRSAHKGIERQHVALGVAIPGDVVGNFGSALQLMSEQATYFYSESSRYWFDVQASVSRKAKDIAERLHKEDIWQEIVDRLNKGEVRGTSAFTGTVVAPSSSADVPDTEGVRLVLLHPKHRHRSKTESSDALTFAQDVYEHRGSANRQHRNTVVFLAPDENEYSSLDTAVRDFIAWRDISGQIDDLGLTRQQETQVKARLAESRRAVDLRLSGTYLWALAPEIHEGHAVQWSKQKIGSGSESLTSRTGAALIRYDALRVVNAPAAIRQALDGRLRARWNEGRISVGELWGYYTQYAYLRRIRDRSVLETGVRDVLELPTWTTEGFALAEGYDEVSGDFFGLTMPMSNDTFGTITDSTLLVDPRLAEKQREREKAKERASTNEPEDDPTRGRGGGGAKVPGTRLPWEELEPATRERAKNVRFTGTFYARAEAIRADLLRVYDEVLSHLATAPETDIEVSVEVIANRAMGFDADTVRVVRENAAQLKFESAKFEDES